MKSSKKGMIFILDGLGDRPNEELNGQTPLEFAHTPNLDRLATNGQCGLMDPLLPGLPVDTHTGVGILFGLPPKAAIMLSRGPIEAAGIGLDMKDGDLLFRANLATIEKQGDEYTIIDRRAGRISDEVSELCQALDNVSLGNGIYGSLRPATQHRCVLRLRGGDLSEEVNDTDPGGKDPISQIKSGRRTGQNGENAITTANAIDRFTQISHDILKNHPLNVKRVLEGKLPGNGVLTRGVGFYRNPKNFISHLGIQTAVVAGESTILGLAKLFGFTCITDPGFTSLPDTDLGLKIQMATEALKDHDLVYVHIKGTDTAAHDRNPALKATFLEQFDQALSGLNVDNIVFGVCADHSTDSIRGEHNGDPVPILIHHDEGRVDGVQRYGETDCVQGALVRFTAQSFLVTVLDAMGALNNVKSSSIEYFT